MSDQQNPRRSRRTAAIIVAVLVVVILAVAGVGLFASRTQSSSSTPVANASGSSEPSTAVSNPPAPSSTPIAKPTPAKTASSPQPTKTTTIKSAAPIVKSLTAKVTRMESVKGTASGPGEIAGPSVRFTISITNSTGKVFDLSSTVVNAYIGADSAPADQLEGPGGKPFPSSVPNGKTVTGVFVFTIPKASRSRVEVTVDTSVNNPVVAFKGSAPQ